VLITNTKVLNVFQLGKENYPIHTKEENLESKSIEKNFVLIIV
jgi:hypothetical protein